MTAAAVAAPLRLFRGKGQERKGGVDPSRRSVSQSVRVSSVWLKSQGFAATKQRLGFGPSFLSFFEKKGSHVIRRFQPITHRRLTNESTEQVIAEFIWNAVTVKQVIAKVPRYIRQPYGDTNDRVRAMFGAFSFKQVIWSCDTQYTKIQSGITGSWRVNDTVQLVNGTTRIGLRATFPEPFFDDTGGYISLEHQLSSEENSAAMQIITLLKKKTLTPSRPSQSASPTRTPTPTAT
ncbi:hypothetical protein DFJ73DRAFT_401424 [Zopfochytrium polystomum]|nr:hypothetical protein DFJ73DRAFT_401424 [Zopfochytrium polystomum]